MASARARSSSARLRVDRKLSSMEVKHMLSLWTTQRGHRYLLKMAGSLERTTWKHAYRLGQIDEFFDWLTIVKAQTPPFKLDHKKAVQAILSCHHSKDGAWLFGLSVAGMDIYAAQISYRLRCVLRKLRDLISNTDTQRALWSKVDGQRKRQTVKLLKYTQQT